jgi:hypothetical protein
MKPTSKSRAIGRRFGHSDDDLTTPGHDALVLWCRDHAQDLLDMYITPRICELQQKAIDWFAECEKERFAREVASFNTYLVEVAERKRRGDSNRPVPVREPRPIRAAAKLPDKECVLDAPILEKPIPGGWIDVFLSGEFYADAHASGWSTAKWCLAIEVKTSIRSLGELLRQLRVYQQFMEQLQRYDSRSDKQVTHAQVLVVSPDARFAQDLRQQGFYFYEPPVLRAVNTQEQANT